MSTPGTNLVPAWLTAAGSRAPQFGALLYRRHAAESALLTTMPTAWK